MRHIYAGYRGDDDLKLDWEGPRPAKAIVKEHDSVAQQAPALLWMAGHGARGLTIRRPGRRARRLMLAHRHAPRGEQRPLDIPDRSGGVAGGRGTGPGGPGASAPPRGELLLVGFGERFRDRGMHHLLVTC
jgi:hypothetical protein